MQMTMRVWPLLPISGGTSRKSAPDRKRETTGFLLLESDPRLAKRLRLALQSPCALFEDESEAMRYLLGQGPFGDRAKHPLPQAILVDLEHPEHSGMELLQWIRLTPALRLIPVIVMKQAFSATDLHVAYTQGAVSCIEFPADDAEAARVAEGLKRYWLGCNLPPIPAPRNLPDRASGPERLRHGS
jgi:CheY-like chemotaxis protein